MSWISDFHNVGSVFFPLFFLRAVYDLLPTIGDYVHKDACVYIFIYKGEGRLDCFVASQSVSLAVRRSN